MVVDLNTMVHMPLVVQSIHPRADSLAVDMPLVVQSVHPWADSLAVNMPVVEYWIHPKAGKLEGFGQIEGRPISLLLGSYLQ